MVQTDHGDALTFLDGVARRVVKDEMPPELRAAAGRYWANHEDPGGALPWSHDLINSIEESVLQPEILNRLEGLRTALRSLRSPSPMSIGFVLPEHSSDDGLSHVVAAALDPDDDFDLEDSLLCQMIEWETARMRRRSRRIKSQAMLVEIVQTLAAAVIEGMDQRAEDLPADDLFSQHWLAIVDRVDRWLSGIDRKLDSVEDSELLALVEALRTMITESVFAMEREIVSRPATGPPPALPPPPVRPLVPNGPPTVLDGTVGCATPLAA